MTKETRVARREPTKMEKAKTMLLMRHPFFATILLKYPLTARESIGTMAVDRRGTIYYNPKFVDSLSVGQLVFGLAHEVMHKVGMHAVRQGKRDHEKWNFACDAWINDTLREAKVGEWLQGIVDIPGSHAKTSEQIYAELPDNQDYSGGGKLGDDMLEEGEPLSEEEARSIETRTKLDMAQAMAVAKMQGKLPGSIERFVASVLEVRTPWYEILERLMTKMVRVNQSWARPNRRFISAGVYLPSYDSQQSMGAVGIIVDTSGSIGEPELAEFSAHTNRIMEQCRPEKVYVLYVDAAVAHVDEFTPDDLPIKFQPHGGGGTDMCAGINWLRRNADELDACIVLTDGLTPFPHDEAWPTFWAITTEVNAPPEAGTTIHIRSDA